MDTTQQMTDIEIVNKFLLGVEQWLCQWDSSDFNSTVIYILLQKYPHLWNTTIERVGHERTGFIEDVTCTLQTESFRIVLTRIMKGYKEYPSCAIYKVNNNKYLEDNWERKASVYSSGSIASCLSNISDLIPNKEQKSSIEAPAPKYIKSEFVTTDDILKCISETVGFEKAWFASEVAKFLVKRGTTRWTKRTEKVGHERTGWVTDTIYTFPGPISFTIRDMKPQHFLRIEKTNEQNTAENQVLFDGKTELNNHHRFELSTIDGILGKIPKPIDKTSTIYRDCEECNKDAVYVVLSKHDQYANRSGWGSGWNIKMYTTNYHKALHETYDGSRYFIRVLLKVSLPTLIETKKESIPDGIVLLMVETCLLGDAEYYSFKLDETTNQVIKKDFTWEEMSRQRKEIKEKLCKKHPYL
jgi:hypothetical protein